MTHTLKRLEQSEVELTITVAPADYQHELEHAAKHLSEVAAIKGFRPGMAPYDVIKRELGEQKILEAALEEIIQKNYFEAAKAEKMETVGSPSVAIEKMAPGNELVFKAKVALIPEIKIAKLADIKVDAKKVEVAGSEIEKVLNDLRKMRMKEVIKNGPATKEDKIVVDMDMFIEKVPVEGGAAKGHQVYLSEEHYIPGFSEQLIGLKKEDEKDFTLKFPAEHYQKNLAGRNVDFKVKTKDVYSLEMPELSDEFAKGIGQKDLAGLKTLVKDNMTREAEQKESQRLEAAILDQLIEKSQFGAVPQVLLDSEKRKMFQELKHDLEHRGIEMGKYLNDIKKTEEQIFNDFQAGAEKRAKAALLARQIAIENDIRVEQKEIDAEVALIRASYGDNPQVEENLKRPEVLDMLAHTVQNRKVVEWLKDKVIKK